MGSNISGKPAAEKAGAGPDADLNNGLVDIRNLSVAIGSRFPATYIINDISLTVNEGETLAIVGESGSGKSVTSLAVMDLLAPNLSVSGEILFNRRDGSTVRLEDMTPTQRRQMAGDEMAMIFQEPMTSLNPVLTIGDQLVEALLLHRDESMAAARARAIEMLALVGISNPTERLDTYVHELSGGMRQRVMIAMALMCSPRLLIADEPTTALDVTIQAQILELLQRLQAELGMAILFISHDLDVVSDIADRIVVFYSGRVVEEGPARQVLKDPKHPYTIGLLNSKPHIDRAAGQKHTLQPISGSMPNLAAPPAGCRFHPRCNLVVEGLCDKEEPGLRAAAPEHRARCVHINPEGNS